MITVEPKRLGVKEGHLILDAGCGEGRHSWELIKGPYGIFSLDLDSEALVKNYNFLKFLGEVGEAKGKHCVLMGNVQALPFPDQVFDHIICSEVLEHVDDQYDAMEELVRVLKPGGVLGVSVPTWITETFYWRLDKNYSHPGGHIRIFRAREMRKLLEAFGLRVYGRDRRHSLHSPYWFLRCLFGLDREDAFFTRTYHRFLCWVENSSSPVFRGLERLFDPLFGKSLVFYARKETNRAVDAADVREALEYRRKK